MQSESGTFFLVSVVLVIIACIAWTLRTGALLPWAIGLLILLVLFKVVGILDRL